jgi:arylsulfatase A-like enzyme
MLSMDRAAAAVSAERPAGPSRLSPVAALLLAVSCGLCGGLLDVGVIVAKKAFWNKDGFYRSPSDFPWTVPAGHAMLLAVPGAAVAALNARRRPRIAPRTAAWLFAALALAGALLRAPLYTAASLVLAAGLGWWISDLLVAAGAVGDRRRLARGGARLLAVLAVLAGLSSGRQAWREARAVAALPPAPPRARNVILIVWDTVRAYDLSSYGYDRDTTPNLTRWARQGVRYAQAAATAPWTFPSQSSFFTGRWPFQLNSQWQPALDTADPTLAEYLASRGYQTVGFAANTRCCSYETGLGRGFARYEDYVLSPLWLLARTVPGKWLLQHAPGLLSDHDAKWAGIESRDARAVDDAFLGWVGRRRTDRPFFAYLNYFDAHEPYIPPPGYERRFGTPPQSAADYQYLVDFVGVDKNRVSPRELSLVRGGYDNCIAYLDDELGRLLDTLRARGLLENTDVIITSDHGEGFGEHNIFGHAYGVEMDECGVPLVILSPTAPAGRVVYSPVSLRDLPATVVDLLGLSAGAPLPGRSLAAYWNVPPGHAPELASPVLCEQAYDSVLAPDARQGRGNPRFQMSLMTMGMHYIRTGTGEEKLYDVIDDPYERINVARLPTAEAWLPVLRKMLLKALTENPGSAEAEHGYLASYRRWLAEAAGAPGPGRVALRR